ncbi:MFS transporter [Streptomyces sp. NPDC085481]|uniref:MFS transporter n=1 Tax=Streptomyces sp. NPDC085481 TaxID=3365727 RepID=UPI0037D6906A
MSTPRASHASHTPRSATRRALPPAARPPRGFPLAALAAPAAMGASGPSLALPAAARESGASPTAVAWLMTVYGLGMAIGTPLLSGTAGRRGPAGTVRAGAALVLIGAAVVLLAPSLPLAVAGRVLEAAGAAGLNVAAFQIAGRDRTGRAPGIVAIGSAVGGTAGLFVGAAVAGAAGWRGALVLPLLSLLVLLPALRAAGPAATAEDRPRSRTGGVPLDVLGDRRFLAAAGLMLALSTVNFALLYGAPRRVAALSGWSPVQIGAAASVATLVGALLSWQLIRTAPRLGTGRTRAVLAGGSLAAAVLASAAPWPLAVLVGAGASSFVTAGGQGTLVGASVQALPQDRHGSAIGLFNLAFLIGVAAGPALAAALVAG